VHVCHHRRFPGRRKCEGEGPGIVGHDHVVGAGFDDLSQDGLLAGCAEFYGIVEVERQSGDSEWCLRKGGSSLGNLNVPHSALGARTIAHRGDLAVLAQDVELAQDPGVGVNGREGDAEDPRAVAVRTRGGAHVRGPMSGS